MIGKNISIDSRKNETTLSQQYRDLELLNFRNQMRRKSNTKKIKQIAAISCKPTQAWRKKKIEQPHVKGNYFSQYELFKEATKLLLFCGQCIGLNPVLGILEHDYTRIRFSVKSFRFAYTLLLFISQTVFTICCFVWVMTSTLSITILGYVSFYVTTTITTAQFMRIAMKWPSLIQQLNTCNMYYQVEPRVIRKCVITTTIFLLLGILEHVLNFLSKINLIQTCFPQDDMYKAYLKMIFPFLFHVGVPYHPLTVILLQCVSITCTLNWTYSDLYVIVLSIYLKSIFETINKQIIVATQTCFVSFSSRKMAPPSVWRSLRESYNKATRLVLAFDRVINSVIFVSFAANLFFICLQVFNVLASIIQHDTNLIYSEDCNNTGVRPLSSYVHEIYFAFSSAFVLVRFLAVTLVASSVNLATIETVQLLYNVPSSVYCDEVQRFIEQTHGQPIALTGMKFFSVTKDIVLTVAGTIVTYELVLLQFNEVGKAKN